MISIGKLTSAAAAVAYLQHAIADNTIEYYAGHGEPAGRWDGSAARALGLSGDVSAAHLAAILKGVHPVTGDDLGRRWGNHRMVGFDVVFSAPKSASILYALGDDDTRAAIVAAHEAGVDAVIAYLEKHAAWARQQNPDTGAIEPVSAMLVMPRFRHRTARPVTDPTTGRTTVDPQLHTHIPVASWVLRPDGSWSALWAEPLYRHAAAAGAVGQAAMRQELIDRLGVEVDLRPNGTFEIRGISDLHRREFSRRRQQIELSDGYHPETIRGREMATLATREHKQEVGITPEMVAEWHDRAIAVGLTPAWVASVLHRRGPALQPGLEYVEVQRILGERGLTRESSTFARRDLVRALAASLPDGATAAQLEWFCDTLLAEPTLVTPMGERIIAPVLEPDGESGREVPEHRYSTPEMVAIEREMLAVATRMQRTPTLPVPDATLTAALERAPSLTTEQRAVVDAVCRDGRSLVLIEGVAGSGKTTALRVVREALEAEGQQVFGCALAGRAAQTLTEEAGIQSTTIHRVLSSTMPLPAGSTLVVDEAGMCGSRQLAQMVARAERDHVRLVLCGDPRQLQPIDAGAAFRGLGDHLGKVELTRTVRQQNEWEREALRNLRQGQVSSAITAYYEHNRIHTSPTAMARRHDVVEALLKSTHLGEDTVVLTRTRNEANAINELARHELQKQGWLAGETMTVEHRPFQVNDRIICTRNARIDDEYVTNGLRAKVIGVDPEQHRMDIRTRQGVELSIDVRRYPHLDHAYALTAHKAQGITADEALVVGSDAANREWAYTVLSRAKAQTRYFTVGLAPTRDLDAVHHEQQLARDDEDYEREHERRLQRAWEHSQAKDMTIDYER